MPEDKLLCPQTYSCTLQIPQNKVLEQKPGLNAELPKQSLLKQAVGRNEAEAPKGITLTQSARTRFGGDSVERVTREGLAKVFCPV